MKIPVSTVEEVLDRIEEAIQNNPGPVYTLEVVDHEIDAILIALKAALDA